MKDTEAEGKDRANAVRCFFFLFFFYDLVSDGKCEAQQVKDSNLLGGGGRNGKLFYNTNVEECVSK